MAVWSETLLSSVEDNYGRFDAEYYRPEFLRTESILSKIAGIKLRNVCSKIDVGHVGPMVRFYSDDGVLLLQTQNVREFFLSLEHCIKITPEFNSKLTKSQVRRGDILIARSGSFGFAAIYLENQIINSADIIIVKLNDPRIDPLFAVTFMNTKYGKNQLIRFASGGVQGHVNLRILEEFCLPIFGKAAQKEVSVKVQGAYDALKTSAESYQQAQHLLESELALNNLSFQKPVGYIARFSDLKQSLRLDAEYFDPVASSIVKRISTFDHVRLGANCNVGNGFPWNSKKFFEDNSGEPVVRIRNIRPSHIDVENLSSIDPKYARNIGFPKAKERDIVVGMDGIKYFYASLLEGGCYVNQRVAHLTWNIGARISPEYATFIINSGVGQAQLLRDMTVATTVGHITNRNIFNLLIPIVSDPFHRQITDLVRQSIDKKQEAKKLLDKAKTRVGQLIEEAVQQ